MIYYFLILIIGFLGGTGVVVVYQLNTIKTILRLRDTLAQRKSRLDSRDLELRRRDAELLKKEQATAALYQQWQQAFVSYDSLTKENGQLKQHLFNLSVQVEKQKLDHGNISKKQLELDQRSHEVAKRYLSDVMKWLAAKMTSSNFSTSKQRLLKTIEQCRGIGYVISQDDENELLTEIQKAYEMAVRREAEREEQARIRAQIREEARLQREAQKLLEEAQRTEEAIRRALEEALKNAKDDHDQEVERLRQQLLEAEEKSKRAISQAQLTKAGHVYVISNIGSFGENVFKIGMTRRLEPLDRIKELASASVPFPFDVHMMISCDNAPGLENALHRELHLQRVNRVNLRKEFFKNDINTIAQIVARHHGQVDFVTDFEVNEYFESLNVTDEDLEYIDRTAHDLGLDNDDDEADIEDVSQLN